MNYAALYRLKSQRPYIISNITVNIVSYLLKVFLASVIITVASKIYLPFNPVPMYLGNLSIMILSLICSTEVVVGGVLLHLGYLVSGIPVAASSYAAGLQVFLSPTGGYLLSLPLISWFISTFNGLFKIYNRSITLFIILLVSNVITFTMGIGFLAYLFDWQFAIKYGLKPFIISDFLIKPVLAVYFANLIGNKNSR
jgi:biotin transport system substrate-specific component